MPIRQKIFDMLLLEDFNHLLIETASTINHIKKITSLDGICQWIREERISKLRTVTSYFSFEALVCELHAYFEIKKEEISKVSTLLVNFKK